MTNKKDAPMNFNIQELKVNVTSDLNIFKFLKGNRPPNPQHIKRLAASIKEFGMLCNPILVNENHEIIDGQHRYLAAKEVKSPVYYIVAKGYALEQVHALNLNQKNWTAKEFLHGYANMGLKDYILLREFWAKHNWLTLNDAVALCSNATSIGQMAMKKKILKDGSLSNKRQDFKSGTWKCKDLKLANDNAIRIKNIETYFKDGYNSTVFVGTMLGMFKNPNFDYSTFMQKLRIQPTALVKCATREQCKMLIEDIYNFKNRNKVNLRY